MIIGIGIAIILALLIYMIWDIAYYRGRLNGIQTVTYDMNYWLVKPKEREIALLKLSLEMACDRLRCAECAEADKCLPTRVDESYDMLKHCTDYWVEQAKGRVI